MMGLARILVVIGGLLMVGFGLWLATYGNEGELLLVATGLLTALFGLVLIGVLAFERMRYRSAASEPPAPAGAPAGESPDAVLEARFRPTAEVFVDPTSGTTMRVYSDPASGERRYRAEA